ncbi:MAG: tRNA-splicing endonuclease subunit sen54, partial [Chaenotheca gracillima]
MSNLTSDGLPPLPSYTLQAQPPLIWPIPDKFLTVILPVVAYWAVSLFFHFIDTYDFLSQYRLHTPAEVLKRNRVSRIDVIRDVIIQQVIQTVVGVLLGMTEPDDFIGREAYDITVWARRIRMAQRGIPGLLLIVGINSLAVAKNLQGSYPTLAGMLSGGHYQHLVPQLSTNLGIDVAIPAFAHWELFLARAIYGYLAPAV